MLEPADCVNGDEEVNGRLGGGITGWCGRVACSCRAGRLWTRR